MRRPITTRAPLSAASSSGLDLSLRRASVRRPWSWRWDRAVALIAVVAAVAAFWVTINAKFLAHPGWLAVQKADAILGPIGVGLYWRHRRPDSRFGLLLIALGLVVVPYLLQSLTSPGAFGVGLVWEDAIYLITLVLILAFPSGRLDGLPVRLILAAAVVAVAVPYLVVLLVSPLSGADGSISGCRAICPRNGLAIWSDPSLALGLIDFDRAATISVALATIGLIVWRFVSGTPPQRRALAIGAPIALLFLVMQTSYQALKLFAPDAAALHDVLQWTYAAARSVLWYGWLFALIAAQLFAGRALRSLVSDSLGRPSFRELEGMLRGPLGDPELRLGFWRQRSRDWAGSDGVELEPPGPGQALTEIARDGRPATAIVHDEQLAEDPELLKAAGAVVLLAEENAELDAAWKRSLGELADSRGRLVSAGARERRKLERDLHDGAQQRLMALQIKLKIAQEHANAELADELAAMRVDATAAVEELRALAHGIYPSVLRERGVAGALRSVAMTSPIPVTVRDSGIGRCEIATEVAVYFCAVEAIQNTIKHAGPRAQATITLSRAEGAISFSAADNGAGMEPSATAHAMGLTGMRDRIEAVGGELEIISSPGRGTVVRASVPDQGPGPARRRRGRTGHVPGDEFPHAQADEAQRGA